MTTRVGTPYYISPEVLDKKYTKACDLWSIGIVLYILLCGFPPFYGENDNEIFRAIQKGDFKFPSPEWDGISEEAKDLISKLLKKDPSKRISASAALVHEWFDKVRLRDIYIQTYAIQQGQNNMIEHERIESADTVRCIAQYVDRGR